MSSPGSKSTADYFIMKNTNDINNDKFHHNDLGERAN